MSIRVATLAVVFSSALFPVPTPAAEDPGFRPIDYPRKWAVIIGIGQYQGNGLRALRSPVEDTRALRELLISDFGYLRGNILYLSDKAEQRRDSTVILAEKKAIREAFVTQLAERHPSAADSLLVYFAGHGTDDFNRLLSATAAPSREGYLAALKSNLGDEDSWVKVSEIVDWMQTQGIPCRHKLLILDCCYSGQLFQRRDARGTGTGAEDALGHVKNNEQVVPAGKSDSDLRYYLNRPAFYGMSAGRDFPALDGGGEAGLSLFASTLLRELRERADSLRADQTFTFRRDLAPQIERFTPTAEVPWQIPDWGRLADGDGDFLFKPTHPRPTPSARIKTAERIALARDEIAAGRYDIAERLLDLCPVTTRAWEWDLLKQNCRQDGRTIRGPGSAVAAIAFHPTESEVAVGFADGHIEVADSRVDLSIRRLKVPTNSLRALAYSPDGSHLAAALGADDEGPGRVAMWDANGKEPKRTLASFRGSALCLAFTKDGSRLLVGGEYPGPNRRTLGEVKVWDTANWNLLQTIDHAAGSVASLSSSPNGLWFHTAGPGGGAMWNAKTFAPVVQLKADRAPAALSPDGKRIAFAANGSVAAYDLLERKRLGAVGRFANGEMQVADLADQHPGPITGLAFTKDGGRIVTVGDDGSARLHDVESGLVLRTIDSGIGPLTALAVRPDGSQFAVGSSGGRARVFELSRFDGTQRYATFGTVFALAVSPVGHRVAVATHVGDVEVRDLDSANGSLHFRPFKDKEKPGGIAFVSGGSTIAVGSRSGAILLIDALTGKEKRKLDYPDNGTIHAIVPSPDGKSFVSVGGTKGRKGQVKLWDAETGALVHAFDGHTDEVWGAAFHPSDGTLATIGVGKDPTLRIWRLNGDLLQTIAVPPWGGYKVAFSPDGRLLAVDPGVLPQEARPPDGLIGAMLWDARTYQYLGMTAGHSISVSGLAFSPDSRRLATSGMDGYIRIWDVSPEAHLGEAMPQTSITLGTGEGEANRLAFTPDGRRLIAASGVGVGRVDILEAPASPELGLRPHDGPRGTVTALTFGPDDRALVEVVTKFGTPPNFDDGRCEVVVRDAISWNPISRVTEPAYRAIMSAALGHESGSVLVSGGILVRGALFQYKNGFVESRSSSGKPTVLAGRDDGQMQFATDSRATRIAVCGKEIKVLRADSLEPLFTFSEPGLKCIGVAIDAKGRRLATAFPDHRVRIFDIDSGKFRDLKGHKFVPTRMTFDREGRRIVSVALGAVFPNNEVEVKLWDIDGEKSVDLKFPAGSQVLPAFTADGSRLLTMRSQPSKVALIQVWDASTGEQVRSYQHRNTLISAIGIRHDGRLLVTGEDRGELRFWDVARLVSR